MKRTFGFKMDAILNLILGVLLMGLSLFEALAHLRDDTTDPK